LTTTAPVGRDRQVDREAVSFASIMKYSSHVGRFTFFILSHEIIQH